MSRTIEFTFPSGHAWRMEVPSAEEVKDFIREKSNRTKSASTNAHKHACKHVGSAINIPGGCSGKQRGIWQCAIFGQCMPLASFRGTPSMPTCLYCDRYEPADDPTLLQEMRSLADATTKWIAAGKPTRSDERQAEILAICNACPHKRQGKLGDWCGVCGCYLKAKVAMATEACPLNPPRWTAD